MACPGCGSRQATGGTCAHCGAALTPAGPTPRAHPTLSIDEFLDRTSDLTAELVTAERKGTDPDFREALQSELEALVKHADVPQNGADAARLAEAALKAGTNLPIELHPKVEDAWIGLARRVLNRAESRANDDSAVRARLRAARVELSRYERRDRRRGLYVNLVFWGGIIVFFVLLIVLRR